MCVVYNGPDTDHQGKEVCFGANETRLSIADVSDKSNPVALASASYPDVVYSHQGWLDDAHEYFYMNDELDEYYGLASNTRTLASRENPVEVAYFDSEPGGSGSGTDGSWSNYPFFGSGVIPVTSIEGGVFFVRLSN